MLKIVGTDGNQVLDEKVIITDEGKLTKFVWKIIVIDIMLDLLIFTVLRKIFMRKKGL